MALAALLAVGPLVSGCAADPATSTSTTADPAGGSPGAGDGLTAAVLDQPYRLSDTTLTGTDGAPFRLRGRLEAPVTLVFFGYTSCPDICPAVLATVTSALSRLPEERADRVAMWFVTTDPARDDAPTLRGYLDRFDPDYQGLTGPLPKLKEVAASVHVALEQGRRLPSGGYEVVHGTPVLAVLPDGTVPALWTEGVSAAELAADLDTVLSSGVPS